MRRGGVNPLLAVLGEKELKEQGALQPKKVVVGNQKDHRTLAGLHYRDAFEVVGM